MRGALAAIATRAWGSGARRLRATGSRRALRLLLGLPALGALLLVVAAALTPLPDELARRDARSYGASVRFTDRDGALLREVRAGDATRARWVPSGAIGGYAERAILAAEDRRFLLHPGVDPLAVARAVVTSVASGRVVSGASTLTMQLARLVRPHRRTAWGKLEEMALALRIEWSLSKREILEEYVNRAPFGPGLRGLEAGSRFYFDKPPSELSLAEAATLAAIPRGPDLYAPQRHEARVLRRRDRILRRLRDARTIDEATCARAVAEPLDLHLARGTFGAPHFVQAVREGALDPRLAPLRGEVDAVTTTLARSLQREAENAAWVTLKPLAGRHVTAASVVVLENATGEVLAYVGSPDFEDAAHGGQNDGVRAKRQPGSTLKPFVYGLGMETLGMTAASALPDVELALPVEGGAYAPHNYDARFHGPVRLREALGSSFNVPAVWTIDRVGVGPFVERLHALGFTSLTEAPSYYGPALALGDGEVTLLDLTNAYATLARGGVWRPVVAVKSARSRGEGAALARPAEERRIMPRAVADVLADVLADKNARLASFGERSVLELPFAVAAKTGTSKGFRDNWTVGFTREVTVGVWVGNFDGSPMEAVSGITGAGPLFRAVMDAAMRGRSPAPLGVEAPRPDDADGGLVRVEECPLSGGARSPACPHGVHEWVPSARRPEACRMHEKVALDRRNGLRAGPGCGAAIVQLRAFERFDATYVAWARAARRDTAPEGDSPLCPGGGDARRGEGSTVALRVGYPRDGARFVIDPDRPRAQQTVPIRALAPSGTPSVDVVIDGRWAGTVRAPFVARWALARGDHVVVADAPGLGPSAPVHLRVD